MALHPVGLAVPVLLPVPRWALTPPFHLFPACRVVCSLWRFPWGYPRRALPGTVPSGVRTFLGPEGPRSSSHPRGVVAMRFCAIGQRERLFSARQRLALRSQQQKCSDENSSSCRLVQTRLAGRRSRPAVCGIAAEPACRAAVHRRA